MLNYQAEVPGKRGIYVGLFAPIKGVAPGVAVPIEGKKPKVVGVLVKVTDLPSSFCIGEGSEINVTIGHAFAISAPAPIHSTLVSMIAPYARDLDSLKNNAGEFLEGKTCNKKVPGIVCDHCGYVQEVTLPISISQIDGNLYNMEYLKDNKHHNQQHYESDYSTYIHLDLLL